MKIAVITGSRADWNGLGMVAMALRDRGADVAVVAIGQHHDRPESLETIKADGFAPLVLKTNMGEDMAAGAGMACKATAEALGRILPDLVIVLGDRFEIAGAATAASLRRIPLAHIGGGDVTEGSVDDKLRYAITALADLHFVTNSMALARIARIIGDREGLIYKTGNPALDRISKTAMVTRETLFAELRLQPSSRNILVAYHAATREADPAKGCRELIAALHRLSDASFLVLGTNADMGSEKIEALLRQFTKDMPRAVMRGNLAPQLFYGALAHFDCMVGNSSAGVVETASFGIPVVNVGDRQKGRPLPINVESCPPHWEAILRAVVDQLSKTRMVCSNPYGDGDSAARIAAIIMQ